LSTDEGEEDKEMNRSRKLESCICMHFSRTTSCLPLSTKRSAVYTVGLKTGPCHICK